MPAFETDASHLLIDPSAGRSSAATTVRTSRLDVAVRLQGPVDGPPVLLLHGWPDDVSGWDGVALILHAAGLRTIAPSLRGFGTTRFLDDRTPRTGNSGMLAMDAIEMMDALGIGRFAIAGHDWGSNTAEAMAVGWPDRISRIAMLSTPPRLGGMPTPPFAHAKLEWYHWFMATARGAAAMRADRRGLAHRLWTDWGPSGWFDDAMFDGVAPSWDNEDWAEVTLHSYRSRWDEAPPDDASAWLEHKVRATKTLALPTIYVQGEADGVNPPAVSQDVGQKFTGPFERLLLPGVGHFPAREAATTVGDRLAAFLTDQQRGA